MERQLTVRPSHSSDIPSTYPYCESGLFNLGFGWVEIGSVTPKPQASTTKLRSSGVSLTSPAAPSPVIPNPAYSTSRMTLPSSTGTASPPKGTPPSCRVFERVCLHGFPTPLTPTPSRPCMVQSMRRCARTRSLRSTSARTNPPLQTPVSFYLIKLVIFLYLYYNFQKVKF